MTGSLTLSGPSRYQRASRCATAGSGSGAQLGRLRRDVAWKKRDDLAVFSDDVFCEIPRWQISRLSKKSVNRRLIRAGHRRHFGEHRERDVVRAPAEVRNFLWRTGFLLAEIVAGEPQHGKSF